jgi:hypothetical protein
VGILPKLAVLAIGAVALALVVLGVSDIYAPAGKIVAGAVLIAIITFDPTQTRKLIWPR